MKRLLNFVIWLSHKLQKKFLVALFQTGQIRVNNYIVCNGVPSSDNKDKWPVFKTSIWEPNEANWSKLIELIDPLCGSLDELLSVQCISVQQKQKIDAFNTCFEKNSALLDTLRRSNIGNSKHFLQCLIKTKQFQVLSLLNSDVTSINRPLNEKRKRNILANYSALVDILDTRGGLLAELVTADCITRRQREFIASAFSPSDTNRRLLDILLRGSESDFDKLVVCLFKSGHYHVCRVLQENSVVAHVVAKLRYHSSNTRTMLYSREKLAKSDYNTVIAQQETLIVDLLTSFLKQSPIEDKKRLRSKILHLLFDNLDSEVELATVNTKHSIGLYFLCKTLPGLQHLNNLFVSGRLKKVLDQIFSILLSGRQRVIVNNLGWNSSNLFKCLQHLCYCNELQVISDLYNVAQEKMTRFVDVRNTSVSFDVFPLEPTEIMLIKAASTFFNFFSHEIRARSSVFISNCLCSISPMVAASSVSTSLQTLITSAISTPLPSV